MRHKAFLAGFLATALLAAWWLFATTVFFPPQGLACLLLLVAAVLLFSGTISSVAVAVRTSSQNPAARVDPEFAKGQEGTRWADILCGALYGISAIFLPWPYFMGPALLAAGFVIVAAEGRGLGILSRLARATQLAGGVLLAQGILLAVYLYQTMHSRDLPRYLVATLAGLFRQIGLQAGSSWPRIAVGMVPQPVSLAATWELLFDPTTLLFWGGGVVFLAWLIWQWGNQQWQGFAEDPGGLERLAWSRFRVLALVFSLWIALWLMLRIVLLVGLHVQRLAITPEQVPAAAGDVFVSPTLHLILTLLAALVAGALISQLGHTLGIPILSVASKVLLEGPRESSLISHPGKNSLPIPGWKVPERGGVVCRDGSGAWMWQVGTVSLAALGGGIVAFTSFWDPPGQLTGSRVLVVERHSTWEPTDRPYDTEHFGHDPSYSYTRAYEYCGQYFSMSRLKQEEAITPERLAACDVLLVKIPTERWQSTEIAAVVDFVRRGGGLLLIGDHTNVFNSSTYLNDLCREFGFLYAHDLLFWMPNAYYQPWKPGYPSHPAVSQVPPLHFAVGCSIDPGRSRGRAAIWSGGLWSLPCDFHVPNYHPVPQWRSDMRYGAFIQLWASRFGRGRILAFTDSTIFSNFCVFQPGKAELLRGMIGWLARRGIYDQPLLRGILPVVLGAIGLALIAAAAVASAWQCLSGVVVVGGIVAGASLGLFAGQLLSCSVTSPLPTKEPGKWLVVDRTTSRVPLALGAFNEDAEGAGYGLLEQWLSRLGYFTARREGLAALAGEGIVIVAPTLSVPHQFREGLIRYVAEGGKLLVLDSPESVGTTANGLVWPFGLEVLHATARGGKIRLPDGGPELEVDSACEVRGGEPFAWIDDLPVAARTRHGKGTVMVLGFASLWNDRNMGGHWMIAEEPTLFRREDLEPTLRERFDALFAILRFWLEDKPIARSPGPSPPAEGQVGVSPKG